MDKEKQGNDMYLDDIQLDIQQKAPINSQAESDYGTTNPSIQGGQDNESQGSGDELTEKVSEDKKVPQKGLTIFGASLAILSTIIGGGVVGLPYSFFHTGIPMGILLNFVFAGLTLYSCMLYIKAKDLAGNSSFSEIGYLLIGRKSIFMINSIVFIGCFQLMVIYFLIIGDIMASFGVEFLHENDTIFTTRAFYVILIGVGLTPLIFKKEIHELKIASILLFIGIFLFVIVFTFQLASAGTDQNGDDEFAQYYVFKFDRQFFTAVAVFMTAYSFQFNLFPVLSSLRTKTNRAGLRAIIIALLMAMCIYIALSVLSIYTFGSLLKPDVISNVGEEVDHEWESITLRVAFAIVLICHIPYVFFSGKESFLILIDELDRRTISKELDIYLACNKAMADADAINGTEEPSTPLQIRKRPVGQTMAYHSMNRYYYIGGTVLVYVLELFLAIVVDDVGVVFQFGAALAGSSVQFIWPGYFYLHAERKFATTVDRDYRKGTRFMAWCYVIMGVSLLFSLLGGTFYNIFRNSEENRGHH